MVDIKDMDEHIVKMLLFRLMNTLKNRVRIAQRNSSPLISPSMRLSAQEDQ